MNKLLSKYLNDSMAPYLLELGFRRKGYTFVEEVSEQDFARVIELSRIRWSEPGIERFTYHCGVFVPEVTATYFDRNSRGIPRTEDCAVSVSSKFLTDDEAGQSWQFDDQNKDSYFEVSNRARVALEELALPFVRSFRTIVDVIEFLVDPKSNKFVLPRTRAQRLVYAAIIADKRDTRYESIPIFEAAIHEAAGSPIESFVMRAYERCTSPSLAK